MTTTAQQLFNNDPNLKTQFGSFDAYAAHCMNVIKQSKAKEPPLSAVNIISEPKDQYQVEKDARAEWNNSAAIRKEFRTIEAYISYEKVRARGGATTHTNKITTY